MTVNELLGVEGHSMSGMCERCWREAALLYANGQGPYESHVAAYHVRLGQSRLDAERRHKEGRLWQVSVTEYRDSKNQ